MVCMDDLTAFKTGDRVQPRHSNRTMTVRRVEGGRVHCTWFDGRVLQEVNYLPEALRCASATGDRELVVLGVGL
jgi:uncharacterized protein YodC (DUF2158 family)